MLVRPRAPSYLLPMCLLAAVLGTSAAGARNDPVYSCARAYERGQVLSQEGHLLEARQRLLECASQECESALRDECNQLLDDVQRQIPTLVFETVDESGSDVASVRIVVDGSVLTERYDGRPLEVDPGDHILQFEARGHTPARQSLLVRQSQKGRLIRVRMPALTHSDRLRESDRPVPVSVYLFGGLGAAAWTGAAYFTLHAYSVRNDLNEKGCAPNCPPHLTCDLRKSTLASDLLLGVGLVSFAASSYLYFTRPDALNQGAAAARSRVDLLVQPGSAMAVLRGPLL